MKKECSFCHGKTDVDCESCESWKCPICGSENKITVEPFELGRGWLDENGICHFPSTIQQIPNGIYIASGTHTLELVTAIVYYPRGGSKPIEYNWDISQSIPKEVRDRMIAVKMDKGFIDALQAEYNERGILLGESDGDIMEKGLTPDEWLTKYKFNGMGALLRQRVRSFASSQR
jgi:hypothetical protein